MTLVLNTFYKSIIYVFSLGDTVDPLDVECQQLVLEVPDGYSHVVLARKQFGARSQLWRMTGEGQLQHEGSSPPRAPPDKILVRVCYVVIQNKFLFGYATPHLFTSVYMFSTFYSLF